jgi:hypothetical protein
MKLKYISLKQKCVKSHMLLITLTKKHDSKLSSIILFFVSFSAVLKHVFWWLRIRCLETNSTTECCKDYDINIVWWNGNTTQFNPATCYLSTCIKLEKWVAMWVRVWISAFSTIFLLDKYHIRTVPSDTMWYNKTCLNQTLKLHVLK